VKRVIAAALAATMLASPALASQWWGFDRATGACVPSRYSPAEFFDALTAQGYAPEIHPTAMPGVVYLTMSSANPDGIPMFQTELLCDLVGAEIKSINRPYQ
jgi:hypothetical protein